MPLSFLEIFAGFDEYCQRPGLARDCAAHCNAVAVCGRGTAATAAQVTAGEPQLLVQGLQLSAAAPGVAAAAWGRTARCRAAAVCGGPVAAAHDYICHGPEAEDERGVCCH